MIFYAVWFACGIAGALIQRGWYKRRKIEHDMAGLDFLVNGLLGPIALIGCLVAYSG